MLKHLSIAAVRLVLTSSAFAQTVTAPPPSDSRTTGTQRQDEPVLPGQSTVPGTEYPNDAQKSLDTPSSGGGGGGSGG